MGEEWESNKDVDAKEQYSNWGNSFHLKDLSSRIISKENLLVVVILFVAFAILSSK